MFYDVVIYRKDKKLQTIFKISYLQPDLSDILLAIRMIVLDADYNFEEYCKNNDLDHRNPCSRKKYREQVKIIRQLSKMFSDKELACLSTTSSTNDDLNKKIIELDSIFEYNRLQELLDTVQYHDKLLSRYGYNTKKDEWNLKKFPITRNDKQMNGIEADVQKFGIAADKYNDQLQIQGIPTSGYIYSIAYWNRYGSAE